ncbi:glutamine amidotransferase [Methylosinus sporium]|uniref:Glutamine amidotransferase n=1 Tax=Methylosinus sporium TaxID=428 RepID=A0A549T2C0_METSR|nr:MULTISPECIES: glutamine amidotransferase [Methylosinus]MBU3889966.1 glutamine amidotransferase [Methylosinus sp. KRF6]TRL36015.1 glutamine amidotransferase [Methylosinus sporium]
MKTALVIRHIAFEDLGSFAEPLAEAGYRIHYVEAGMQNIPAEAAEADLLIVLGGPIGVYQTEDYPFLAQEVALLRARLGRDAPTLGVCLGCQLMAAALGARVYPGGAGKEIGFAPITLTEAGRDSALAALVEPEADVLHWHGDTFDLPEEATLLASSALYPHQAFAMGRRGLALQFHPEAEKDSLERWFIGHTAELSSAGVSIAGLRAVAAAKAPGLQERSRRFIARWLAEIAK